MLNKFVVLDLETTGLSPKECGVTEVVALQYNENFEFEKAVINQLTAPGKTIPKVVEDLTGITNEMVLYQESASLIMKKLNEYSEKQFVYVVAHNAQFEKMFMQAYSMFDLNTKFICTRALFLAYKDGNTFQNNFKKNYSKLKQVCEEFNIPYDEEKAHRAEYDVLQTAKVAERLIRHFGLEKSLEISRLYMSGKHWGKRKQLSIFELGVY